MSNIADYQKAILAEANAACDWVAARLEFQLAVNAKQPPGIRGRLKATELQCQAEYLEAKANTAEQRKNFIRVIVQLKSKKKVVIEDEEPDLFGEEIV